jgi:AraC-like DNA-binding protein
LRLDGAIFFRAEFTERWAYRSPTPDQLTRILRPGAARLIIFHIVAAGACWVRLDGGERLWASEGNVIVVPYGDQHAMGGAETAALPPLFVVRPPEGPAATWIRSSVEFALAAGSRPPQEDPTATRLSELVLLETLRLHLATAPAIDTGWLAALADPVLAPAVARLLAAPARRWTVEQLARTVAVSQSVLDERFRQVLGRSPIRYLTDWRMHLAEDLLIRGMSVANAARRVGYDSEESFSRAFKRTHAVSPGAWRRAVGAGH